MVDSRATTRARWGATLALVTAHAAWGSDGLAAPSVEFVLADGTRGAGSLVALEYDAQGPVAPTFRLETDAGALGEGTLVRWGALAPPSAAATLVLRDGTRLASDRPWSASGYFRLDGDHVGLRRGDGWAEAPRTETAWALVEGGDPPRIASPADADTLVLASGDELSGKVVEVSAEKVTIAIGGEPLATPLSRVRAIRFAGEEPAPRPPYTLAGLADGSLVVARRLRVADGALTAETPSGLALATRADRLTYVQPVGGAVRYLSDEAPSDFRHTPYFDLVWPLGRDADLGGGALIAHGRRHAKGLAMRSAARAVYALDGAPGRFQAEVAVADQPDGPIGCVEFRVYLVRDGKLTLASPGLVVRGGEPPRPIDVAIDGAAALVLVVDFAEGGDTGDHALWLDARLVSDDG